MERNVAAVRGSDRLKEGARELVARAVEASLHLHEPGHFTRGGRKAFSGA